MTCRPAGLALALVIALAILFAPLAAEAQQAGKVVRIGYLSFSAPAPLDDVFKQALRDLGWVEGQNLVIEYRSAGRDLQRLRPLAEELVRLRVALIVTVTGRAALVAKEVTSSVPIVMAVSGDAVSQGIVASLARPGGNVTGVSSMAGELGSKRVGLLQELVPRATRLAALVNPNNPLAQAFVADIRAAAPAIGQQIEVLTASTSRHDQCFRSE